MKKIGIIFIILFTGNYVFSQDIVIVTATKSITKLTKAQLQDIYRSKLYEVNGQRVSFIDHERNTKIYGEFIKKYFNMDSKQMTQYWVETKLETGKKPPKFLSDQFIPRALISIKGSITYYYKEEVPAKLYIVQIQ